MYTRKYAAKGFIEKRKLITFCCCLINSKREEGSRDSALGEDVTSKVATLKIYVWEFQKSVST